MREVSNGRPVLGRLVPAQLSLPNPRMRRSHLRARSRGGHTSRFRKHTSSPSATPGRRRMVRSGWCREGRRRSYHGSKHWHSATHSTQFTAVQHMRPCVRAHSCSCRAMRIGLCKFVWVCVLNACARACVLCARAWVDGRVGERGSADPSRTLLCQTRRDQIGSEKRRQTSTASP